VVPGAPFYRLWKTPTNKHIAKSVC
jgi:hypothetical protein